jgi:hypothetical protein
MDHPSLYYVGLGFFEQSNQLRKSPHQVTRTPQIERMHLNTMLTQTAAMKP